jgi:hypothetical protein
MEETDLCLSFYGRNGVLLIGRGVAYRKTEETDLSWSAYGRNGVLFIGRGVAYRKTGLHGLLFIHRLLPHSSLHGLLFIHRRLPDPPEPPSPLADLDELLEDALFISLTWASNPLMRMKKAIIVGNIDFKDEGV